MKKTDAGFVAGVVPATASSWYVRLFLRLARGLDLCSRARSANPQLARGEIDASHRMNRSVEPINQWTWTTAPAAARLMGPADCGGFDLKSASRKEKVGIRADGDAI